MIECNFFTVTCDQCTTQKEFSATEYTNNTFGVSSDHLLTEGWYEDGNSNAEGDHFCPDCAVSLGLYSIDEVREVYEARHITVSDIEDSEHYHFCDDEIYDEPLTLCGECGETFPADDEFCHCQNED